MIGLTGGIGAGKSTVAELLAARGAVIIDADQIARDVVETGTPTLAALVDRFGPEILTADGRLDRGALAARAFADDESKAALDSITHPAIAAEFLRRLESLPADAIVIHDVPLLVESGRASQYEAIIVVEAPLETRLQRLEARGVERSDAQARIAKQASDVERRAVATWLLDNRGDLTALAEAVDEVWRQIATPGARPTDE